MRIEHVEVVNLRFSYPGGTRVRLRRRHGDEPRHLARPRRSPTAPHVGIGAAYSHPDLVKLIVERHLAPHLVGRDPTDVEELWELGYGLTRWYGRKGAAISALGGARHRVLGPPRQGRAARPSGELLGAERSRSPAYASGLFWADDVGELEARGGAPPRARLPPRQDAARPRSRSTTWRRSTRPRRGVGEGNDVIVDGSHRYSLERAAWMGAELAARDVFWFEEPFPPEDIDSYVALRPRIDVPLAAGENEFGVQGFRETDPRRGARRRAARRVPRRRDHRVPAHRRDWRATPACGSRTHTWSDAVALVANAHVVAALPNGLTVEVDQTGNPFIEELLVEPLEIADGQLQLGVGPGPRDRAGRGRRAAARRRLRRLDARRELLRPDLRAGLRERATALRRMTAPAGGILDSHHHLWDVRALRYPLFDGIEQLERRFGLDDYAAEARRAGIVGSIVVEAASAGPDGDDELAWLLDEIGAASSVRGVVAWAPLERPDVDAYLGRARTRAGRLLVGVRRSFEFEDDGFAARPQVIDGARCAGAHGLVVDLVLYARSLPSVLALVDACPDTSFVLDHLGKPRVAEGELEPWALHLRELSLRSNVTCKLSGLPAEAASDGWTPAQLAPYVDHAVACFGPDRLLFGTDWPVLCRRGSIPRWQAVVAERLAGASAAERTAVYRATAERIYGLPAG